VKLSLNVAKDEARKQPPLSATEPREFIVGPAPTMNIQRTSNSAPNKDNNNTDDSIITNDILVDKKQQTAATDARKETVSLLLDRSKRLRDAMINSILETEDTIKEAETLYKTKSIPQIRYNELCVL